MQRGLKTLSRSEILQSQKFISIFGPIAEQNMTF